MAVISDHTHRQKDESRLGTLSNRVYIIHHQDCNGENYTYHAMADCNWNYVPIVFEMCIDKKLVRKPELPKAWVHSKFMRILNPVRDMSIGIVENSDLELEIHTCPEREYIRVSNTVTESFINKEFIPDCEASSIRTPNEGLAEDLVSISKMVDEVPYLYEKNLYHGSLNQASCRTIIYKSRLCYGVGLEKTRVPLFDVDLTMYDAYLVMMFDDDEDRKFFCSQMSRMGIFYIDFESGEMPLFNSTIPIPLFICKDFPKFEKVETTIIFKKPPDNSVSSFLRMLKALDHHNHPYQRQLDVIYTYTNVQEYPMIFMQMQDFETPYSERCDCHDRLFKIRARRQFGSGSTLEDETEVEKELFDGKYQYDWMPRD